MSAVDLLVELDNALSPRASQVPSWTPRLARDPTITRLDAIAEILLSALARADAEAAGQAGEGDMAPSLPIRARRKAGEP